jgi:hypothetical protein
VSRNAGFGERANYFEVSVGDNALGRCEAVAEVWHFKDWFEFLGLLEG